MNKQRLSGILAWAILLCILAYQQRAVAQVTSRPVAALIFCDVSGSIDSMDIGGMARDVGILVSRFPPGSKVVVYPIECTSVPRPMVEITKPGTPRRPSDVRVYTERAHAMANQTAVEILRVYRLHFSSNPRCTCILSTLRIAEDFFKQFGEGYSKQLVYFSDMLENCATSSVNILSFEDAGFDSARAILRNYTPGADLHGIGLGVIILPPSYGRDSAVGFPLEQREAIWREIFRKAGVGEDEFTRWGFSMILPDRYNSQAMKTAK